MSYQGRIIIIDDDQDDLQMYKEVFTLLGYPNKILLFSEPDRAYENLMSEQEPPFLIISDIRFPKSDGFALKKKLLEKFKARPGEYSFRIFLQLQKIKN